MSTCGEVGSDVHALIKELAIRRVQHRSVTPQRVPTSGGRDRSTINSTSSAAILFCFTASTFIPQTSPSLQTGGGVCEHPTAPFARPGVCTSASYWGVNGSKGQEGANGGGGGIGVGGGNGDGNGNGVRGENGDMNGHGDGVGAGTGTGVEVNEGAQDGNGVGSGDGAGTGTGTGVETRRRTPDGNGDGSEDSSGDGNGNEDNGNRNEDRIGEGGRESKSARNHKIVVDATRETGEAWVGTRKNVEKKELVQYLPTQII